MGSKEKEKERKKKIYTNFSFFPLPNPLMKREKAMENGRERNKQKTMRDKFGKHGHWREEREREGIPRFQRQRQTTRLVVQCFRKLLHKQRWGSILFYFDFYLLLSLSTLFGTFLCFLQFLFHFMTLSISYSSYIFFVLSHLHFVPSFPCFVQRSMYIQCLKNII